MLYVTLRQRIIERCKDPKSANYNQITKMACKPIEGFLSYSFDIVPRIGETILLDGNVAYDVISVVHSRRYCAGLTHPEVIVEVIPHVYEHVVHDVGYSFTESWPLISDLELDEAQK